MRLIIVDRATEERRNFWPVALSRPIWDLRCGFTSLGDKLQKKIGTSDVAYFLPAYMAEAYREKTGWRVNDNSALKGEDILIVDARVKADSLDITTGGRSEVQSDGSATPTLGTGVLRTTGGFLYFATSNVLDLAGAALSEPTLEDFLEDIFAHTNAGDSRTALLGTSFVTVMSDRAGKFSVTFPYPAESNWTNFKFSSGYGSCKCEPTEGCHGLEVFMSQEKRGNHVRPCLWGLRIDSTTLQVSTDTADVTFEFFMDALKDVSADLFCRTY